MPDYDFGTLSPTDFEILVCELLRKRKGLDFKAFGHGPDGGVDLIATAPSGDTHVVQCKHYRDSGFSALLRSARVEKVKMDILAPDHYSFATSQSLTYKQQVKLVETLHPWVSSLDQIVARNDMNVWLAENPDIERRNFKLWMASTTVLRRIVDNGLWTRNEILVEQIQDRVRRYVDNANFYRAAEMLDTKGVCVITGAPGVGKSMIAEMLALTYWNTNWQVVALDSHEISHCWDAWERDAPQIFYFDDVFGQTDISESLGKDAGKVVARLVKSVGRHRNKKLIITSRTHILRDAQFRDEEILRSELSPRECIVKLTDYTLLQKAKILCNHLYFSDIDREVLRQFASGRRYEPIVKHPNFTPRIIEQTILQYEADQVDSTLGEAINSSLARPVLLWGTSFRISITEAARRLLVFLVAYPVSGVDTDQLRDLLEREFSPEAVSRAIRQLEGSWIHHSQERGSGALTIKFNDPSCRDFLLAYIDEEPSHYLGLIRRLPSLGPIVNVLRYGFPENRSKPKCPKAAKATLRNWSEVSQIVKGRLRATNAEVSPDQAVDVIVALWEMFAGQAVDAGWLVEEFQRFTSDMTSMHLDPHRVSRFLLLWRRHLPAPKDPRQITAIELLLEGMISDALTTDRDTWVELHDFAEWLAPEIEGHDLSAWRLALRERFSGWLDNEVESLIDQSSDRMLAELRIDALRCDSDKILGYGVFDDRYPRLAVDIDQIYYLDGIDNAGDEVDNDLEDDEQPSAYLTKFTFPYREKIRQQSLAGDIDEVFRVLE